jgi:hypothetical protein
LGVTVPRGVEPPTFGLGNRFDHKYFNHLQPDVANVLHPFPRGEILIISVGNSRSHDGENSNGARDNCMVLGAEYA